MGGEKVSKFQWEIIELFIRQQHKDIPSGGTDDETSDDTGYITMPGRQAAQNGETSEPPLRRSTRQRLPM